MGRGPTVEHLVFPGLSREDAVSLELRLEALGSGARLFASGLLGHDVEIIWTLGYPDPIQWMRSRDGKLCVRLSVDLLEPLAMSLGADMPETVPPEAFVQAFRAGFLHMLGRVLGAEIPPGDPVGQTLTGTSARWRRLGADVRARLAQADGPRVAGGVFDELESARTDGLLLHRFKGAAQHLHVRTARALSLLGGNDPVLSVLGFFDLVLLDAPGIDLEEAATVVTGGDPEVADQLVRLSGRLQSARVAEPRRARKALAEFVVYDLLRVLLHLEEALKAAGRKGDGERVAGGEDAGPRAAGLAGLSRRNAEITSAVAPEWVGSEVVLLPHAEGGLAMVRIERAEARGLEPDKITRRVLRRMLESYGPQAMEAFSEESAALRRALGVNWERRYKGRYRSGKRVGMANLRRFVMEEDLRLFQRLQVPDSLSYYFHLVVDTSYSMLEQHNAEKAFAIAYAFTELLHEYRVPVDVTLYSSGVTDLYDHQRDTLEPFFGREFGYLVSGTLEMEAVAYAKAKADRVQERRKIIVVITDGTPSAITLPHVGSPDMTTYYRETFIPWLREAGIELMAIGIGLEPSYHERAVTLSESWEAIPVLIELLEEIVREGEQRVQALWV